MPVVKRHSQLLFKASMQLIAQSGKRTESGGIIPVESEESTCIHM